MTADGPRPAGEDGVVVHACPEDGSGVTGCCGRTPFELGPFSTRLTLDPALVTCRGECGTAFRSGSGYDCGRAAGHDGGHSAFPDRPAASGGATDGEPAELCEACSHVDFAHASHRGCCRCDCERINYGSGWDPPAPVASQADGELREEIGSGLCRLPRVWTGDFGPYEIADAVLALPRMRHLLADAEKVRRVEALCGDGGNEAWVSTRAVRRALDGDR